MRARALLSTQKAVYGHKGWPAVLWLLECEMHQADATLSTWDLSVVL